MRAKDVFTPGSSPTVTLVRDHLERSKEIFEDALDQGGVLINISGPSKSGKTVFVKSLIGADNLLPITGAGASCPGDLWERVFHQIGTEVPKEVVDEASSDLSIGASLKTSGSMVVVKAEGGGSVSANLNESRASSYAKPVDLLQLLVSELGGTEFVVFIDDFHYIPKSVQSAVAAEIKEAISKGVRIVCASVPHHSEDVLRANPDLRGRVVTLDFDYWESSTLSKIADKGFSELNIDLSPPTIRRFAQEAAGSPQLMQSICLNACYEAGYREFHSDLRRLPGHDAFIEDVCVRASLGADYSSTIERLREGPKVRGSERTHYRLRRGDVGDVYTILLQALSLDPPILHFRYAELQDRIRKVCETKVPPGSSVTGSCSQIANLANSGSERIIVEWDGSEEVLNIRDPYLLFYLRWSGSARG